MTVLAAAKIPAPFPENFETANSAFIERTKTELALALSYS